MASAKNQLQEIYQKRHSPTLPTYSHKQALAGAGWASSVTLPDEPTRFFQGFGRTKRDADQEAAQKALEFLNSMETSTVPRPAPPMMLDVRLEHIMTSPLLILIDLENSPKFMASRWENVRWPACRLEAFVGRFSSHAEKNLEALYPFIHTFHVIASGHRDAVDHAISVRAGQWLSCPELQDGVMIISRDRFAAALVDVLRQQTEKEIEHHVNMDRCFDALKKRKFSRGP